MLGYRKFKTPQREETTLKRLTVFFVLALTLVTMAALTSCGCGASVQDSGTTDSTTGSENGTGTNGSTNSGASNGNANNGNANNGGSSIAPGNGSVTDDIIQGGEDIMDGVDNAIDDITGNTGNGSHDGGVTYDDMLQDGNVTDNDGMLGNEPNARRR